MLSQSQTNDTYVGDSLRMSDFAAGRQATTAQQVVDLSLPAAAFARSGEAADAVDLDRLSSRSMASVPGSPIDSLQQSSVPTSSPSPPPPSSVASTDDGGPRKAPTKKSRRSGSTKRAGRRRKGAASKVKTKKRSKVAASFGFAPFPSGVTGRLVDQDGVPNHTVDLAVDLVKGVQILEDVGFYVNYRRNNIELAVSFEAESSAGRTFVISSEEGGAPLPVASFSAEVYGVEANGKASRKVQAVRMYQVCDVDVVVLVCVPAHAPGVVACAGKVKRLPNRHAAPLSCFFVEIPPPAPRCASCHLFFFFFFFFSRPRLARGTSSR